MQLSNRSAVPAEGETVDKSMVVIGSFGAKSMEEVDSVVQELLKNVAGFKDVEVTFNYSPMAFAHFESTIHASRSKEKCEHVGAQALGVRKPLQGQAPKMQNRK